MEKNTLHLLVTPKYFTLFTGFSNACQILFQHLNMLYTKIQLPFKEPEIPLFYTIILKIARHLKRVEKFAKVNVITNNISDKRYGPGWAWEDFDSYFSAERSAFPIYGNVVTVQNEDSIFVQPAYYQPKIKITDNFYGRDEYKNNFYFRKDRKSETEIPMIIDSDIDF